jgi:thiamine pyrophosphokinase
MSKFVILLAGPVSPTARLKVQVENARVIAADGGMAHAHALQVEPELWVGDFDSSSRALQEKYESTPRQTHAVEKDATDGELAISEAMRRGATELILVGGLGGQFDHTLAHATFLIALAKRGIPIFMTSGIEEAYPLLEHLEFDTVTSGIRLSIVPLSDLKAITITGVKWPLENRNVPLGSALTLSNIVTGRVTITLKSGTALAMLYPLSSE